MNKFLSSTLLLACCLLACGLALPAAAQVAEAIGTSCPDLPDPVVRVDTYFDAPAYNFEQPLPRLKEIVNATASAVLHKEQPVGFAVGELNFAITLHPNMVAGTDGRICARPADVHVEVGFHKNAIYVARELPRGDCGHAEVLAHEEGHVAIDRQLLEDYRPILQRFAEAAVGKLGVLRALSPADATHRMQDFINDQLQQAATEMNKDRGYRQQAHDSPEEYLRLARVCNGELPIIVAQYATDAVPTAAARAFHVPAVSAKVPATSRFSSY